MVKRGASKEARQWMQRQAAPYGLQIGDMLVNGAWTRNQDGEQITLDENATYDELVAKIAELEALLNDNAE